MRLLSFKSAFRNALIELPSLSMPPASRHRQLTIDASRHRQLIKSHGWKQKSLRLCPVTYVSALPGMPVYMALAKQFYSLL